MVPLQGTGHINFRVVNDAKRMLPRYCHRAPIGERCGSLAPVTPEQRTLGPLHKNLEKVMETMKNNHGMLKAVKEWLVGWEWCVILVVY